MQESFSSFRMHFATIKVSPFLSAMLNIAVNPSDNTTSKILNIPVFNTDHKNIDNKLSGGIFNMIRNTANANNEREGVPEICPAYE